MYTFLCYYTIPNVIVFKAKTILDLLHIKNNNNCLLCYKNIFVLLCIKLCILIQCLKIKS